MDAISDLDFAHGAEVEIEVHAPPRSVVQHAGLLPPGQQPLQQTPHAPGRPFFSQTPSTKLTAQPLASSARFSVPSTGYTLGTASSTPSGPQLGTGLPHGAAAAGVPYSMYSTTAPPGPTALPGGWYQPGSIPSFGQQLPWPAAYPPLNFPMVCITLILSVHYPLPYGFGSCLVL